MRQPEDDHAPAEDADDDEQLAAGHAAERPTREHDPGEQGAHRRRAAQHAEPDGADVEDVAGEERQQRDRAAEQDRDEVERDRAEQHRRPPHEAEPGEQRAEPGAEDRRGACSTVRGLIVDGDARRHEHERERRPRRRASGRIAKSTPPIAGPVTTVAWPTVERSASALVSSSIGTRVGHIERIAGLPSAADVAAREREREERPERVGAAEADDEQQRR